MNKVFVTGMGVVSAIGNNVSSSFSSLESSKNGIEKAHYFKSKYTENLLFGEVKLSNDDLVKKTNSENETGLSRTTLLAYLAVDEAISKAELTDDEISSFKTGFISSSTVGGMSNTDELYADANLKGEPSEFATSYGGGEHVLRIIKRYNIKGFTSTINTACSSSVNAIILGTRLIQSGRLDRVIVGGTDSLAKYTVNGFNSLMILTDNFCQPFDENRKGLNLGEGAGFLVLESERVIQNKKSIAEVTGFGNANDAYHPSATSPEAFGPRLAMKKAIELAQISPNEIDYINAHGTGTVNNDETELFAFNETFETIPPFNSTKSYTGHTLAASGVIESIFSLISLNENMLFPSLNCEEPIGNASQYIIKSVQKKEMNMVMSNSFGFGGNCSSIIFKKTK